MTVEQGGCARCCGPEESSAGTYLLAHNGAREVPSDVCTLQIDEFLTTGTVALLDPAEDAQKAADKQKAAAVREQTETAYAFL